MYIISQNNTLTTMNSDLFYAIILFNDIHHSFKNAL